MRNPKRPYKVKFYMGKKTRIRTYSNAVAAMKAERAWRKKGKRAERLSLASIGSYKTKIEDVYHSLDQAGLHHSQMGPRLVTNKDIYRGKDDAFWKIKVPIRGSSRPMLLQTYSEDKDVAQRYIKAVRLVQKRSSPSVRGGYMQGLYKPRPRPTWR